MIVGAIRLTLRLHGCRSLKEKRRPRQALAQKIRNAFSVSVSEVADQDVLNMLTLGVATVGPHRQPVEQVLERVADFVEESGIGELVDQELHIERY